MEEALDAKLGASCRLPLPLMDMMKGACAILAAFSRIAEESIQYFTLLMLTERWDDNCDDADKDHIGPGKGNAIRGSKATYIG